MNVQANQRIDAVESSLNQKLDGLQNDPDQKIDNLQYSISRLTNQQHVHSQEENPEEECLIDTTIEEHCKKKLQGELIETFEEFYEGLSESSDICAAFCPSRKNEAISPLLTKEGSGKEAVEEPQKLILKPFPIKLNPSATVKATNSPPPTAPSSDLVPILPTLATDSTLEAPTAKAEAIPSALPAQNFRKLVASVQTFATTSRILAAAHTA